LANASASPAVEATQASPKRALLAANTQAVMAPEARDYHLPTLFETIVVSGTRTPKTLEDSPVPIDIISAEDLHLVTTGTLANALEFIPGVVISRSIGKEGYNVMMQGFDSDRVLVLVDGLPLISPTGESVDLDQISANDIERIEVVRGAASVLYGSSAMGGVINIFTKQYTDNGLRLLGTVGHYGDYALEDNNTLEDYVATGYKQLGRWNVKLTAQLLDRPGFKYDSEAVADDSASVEKQFLNAQIRTQLPHFRISYQPQYFEEDKLKVTGLNERFEFYPNYPKTYYTSRVRQSQHDLSLFGKKSWQLKARTNLHKEASGYDGAIRDTRIENNHIDGQNIWQLSWGEVVAGVKLGHQSLYQIKQHSGEIEVDASRNNRELFGQGDFDAAKNWNLVVGFRAQNDSDFGNHTALRLNSLWSPNAAAQYNFQWRTSLGEGYRVPSLKERYYVFDHSALGYVVKGNPDLKPETSLSFNNSLSVDLPIADKHLDIELSTHVSNVDNLIETVHNAAKDYEGSDSKVEYNEYTNHEKARLSGVDFSLGQSGKWRWQINYSYLDAINKITDERIPERPRHQFKANIWVPVSHNQKLLIYGTYEADSYDPRVTIKDNYTLINARWDWNINDFFKWKIGIDNIGNTHAAANWNRVTEFDMRPVSSCYIFTTLEYSLK
ncbi:MAG TPA: TonB-dependent receptor, partial [Marinagarivorans sp.]